jgi:CheY-like chemotaxis protein
VSDGAEALKFLEQRPPYADAPRPGLVLLDLNLPGHSGIEVLERIKTDDELKQIPVLMLTSSDASDDIEAAYQNHANAYLVKPIDIDECESLAAQIERFWLHTTKLSQSTDDI